MAIRVKPRAKVEDSFLDTTVAVAQHILKQYAERWSNMEDWRVQQERRAKRIYLGMVMQIAKNERDVAGKGIDLWITRLRNFPYERFFAYKHNNSMYLAGETRTIIMERAGFASQRWDIGKWGVYVKVNDIINGSTSGIQMLPLAHPDTLERHPHHYAHRSSKGHPLDLQTSTCLGSFNGPLSQTYQAFDIPEIFRLWYKFLSVYNAGSPLLDVDRIPHARSI